MNFTDKKSYHFLSTASWYVSAVHSILQIRKVQPRTCHESPEREQSYSSTLSLNSAIDWGWVVNATHRPLHTRERDPVSIVQEAGWATGLVWTAAENLASTGIRPPDRPACSEKPYRPRYLGPLQIHKGVSKYTPSSPLFKNEFHLFKIKTRAISKLSVVVCVPLNISADFHQTWYERVTLSAANPTQGR
jgi:hypothetical protein